MQVVRPLLSEWTLLHTCTRGIMKLRLVRLSNRRVSDAPTFNIWHNIRIFFVFLGKYNLSFLYIL